MEAPFREAFGDDERNMVLQCIDYYGDRLEDPPYDGHFQRILEKEFANKLGGGFALAVSTGSAACYLAIKSLNLPANSTILMSPVSDTSSLSSIILAGHKPVIVDTLIDSYNSSAEQFEQAYSWDVSAIYLVHTYGKACEAEEIAKFCQRKGIQLIEDCSQAPFARTSHGSYVGTLGSVAAFSTMYRKTLQTSSCGGIIYTKSEGIYNESIEYSDRGRKKWSESYNPSNPGSCTKITHNFNASELNCAVGVASLKRIDSTINKRIAVSTQISSEIEKRLNDYLQPMKHDKNCSPFLLPIIMNNVALENKTQIVSHLKNKKVPFAPRYECFAYDWELTKYNLKDTTKRRIQRLGKKSIYCKNAMLLKASTFNLFLNERYTSSYAEFIVQTLEEAILT